MADQEEHHHTATAGVVATDGCELEKQRPGLLKKLQQRSDTSSSSSSDEEVEGQGGEKKKKKKKGLKEKLEDKMSGGEKMEVEDEDNSIPIEKVEVALEDATCDHEEKGFLEKIKAKLPASHLKKAEDGNAAAADDHSGEAEAEKKGLFEKIKEKLPGYHRNGGEETDKEKEKEISANH